MVKLNPEKYFVRWYEIGFGLFLYVCHTEEHHQPLGFVWGTYSKKQFIVYGSFVPAWARRQGVRTKINHQILEHCSVITSPEGTKEGGEAFMRAFGYKQHPAFGWIYTKKKKKEKTNASRKLSGSNHRRRRRQSGLRRNGTR